MSYCKPDRKETVYYGKDLNGESVYKPKHYLLWTFHEMLNQFNPDESFTLPLHFIEHCIRAQTNYMCRQDCREQLLL